MWCVVDGKLSKSIIEDFKTYKEGQGFREFVTVDSDGMFRFQSFIDKSYYNEKVLFFLGGYIGVESGIFYLGANKSPINRMPLFDFTKFLKELYGYPVDWNDFVKAVIKFKLTLDASVFTRVSVSIDGSISKSIVFKFAMKPTETHLLLGFEGFLYFMNICSKSIYQCYKHIKTFSYEIFAEYQNDDDYAKVLGSFESLRLLENGLYIKRFGASRTGSRLASNCLYSTFTIGDVFKGILLDDNIVTEGLIETFSLYDKDITLNTDMDNVMDFYKKSTIIDLLGVSDAAILWGTFRSCYVGVYKSIYRSKHSYSKMFYQIKALKTNSDLYSLSEFIDLI